MDADTVKNKNYNELNQPIAIIGISGKFPGANDLNTFWDNMASGKESIGEIPGHRKQQALSYIQYTNKIAYPVEFMNMGYLDQIDQFDFQFFGLSPAEACSMDPNQRIFLQQVWHAIEDAGYGNGLLKGTQTGIYLGYSEEKITNYLQMLYELHPDRVHDALPGNINSVIASRIAYILDLHGPSMVVNTACSSSLVAVQLACQSLCLRDSDVTIAGGISLQLLPVKKEGSLIASSDGHTRTFDNDASGTGLGEASIAVVLKRMCDAVQDRDAIYAVIKGGAITQDGNSIGITAPNADAQCMAIQKAWKNACIDPCTIRYVEAHGTATPLGDPIEIDGIQKAFSPFTDHKQFCAIGSLKSNIGHTDNAAGLAGLVKTVLMLQKAKILPTLHFQEPNNEIEFYNSPVYIADQLMPWDYEGFARRAGVSSFGLSGTNCHIVLEEYCSAFARYPDEKGCCLFTISAKTEAGVHELITRYRLFIEKNPWVNAADICRTVNTARGHYNKRIALVAGGLEELRSKLDYLACMPEPDSCQERKIFMYDTTALDKVALSRQEWKQLSQQATEMMRRYQDTHDVHLIEQAARWYVEGADIDWSSLYPNGSFQKIPVPGYPFAETVCWLDFPETQKRVYEIQWTSGCQDMSTNAVKPTSGQIVYFDTSDAFPLMRNFMMNIQNTIVSYGPAYREDGRGYIVEDRKESYEKLLNALRRQGDSFIVLIPFFGHYDAEAGMNQPLHSLFPDVFRLFRLILAALESGNEDIFQFRLLMKGGVAVNEEDPLYEEYAAALGFAKCLCQEYPDLRLSCIDTDDCTTPQTILQRINEEGEFLTAYRSNIPYYETLKPAYINQFTLRLPEQVSTPKVYLITGGTGGMGLVFAEYMARKESAVFVLIGRTVLPAKDEWDRIAEASQENTGIQTKIRGMLVIEQLGSHVIYETADCSDYWSLKEITQKTRSRFGRICGVFHAAGIADSCFLINKEEQRIEQVMAGKIGGALYLDHLTTQDKPDFFICCGAASTLTGIPGQSAYVAANAFLDAFAQSRRKQGKHILTIDWPAWTDVGLAMDLHADIENGFFKPLNPKQAMEYMEGLLYADAARVIIGEINPLAGGAAEVDSRRPLNTFIKGKKNELTQPAGSIKKQVVLMGKTDGEYTETEMVLASFWNEVLGLDPVDITVNFYDMGGNSIYGMRLVNRISGAFSIRMNIVDLMNHLTILSLAAFIDSATERNHPVSVFVQKIEAHTKDYAASLIQKNLFVLNQMWPDNQAYHVLCACKWYQNIDYEELYQALRQVVRRHEAFRTSFSVVDGEITQHIEPEENVSVRLEHLTAAPDKIQNKIQMWIKPFELDRAPLFRFALFHEENQRGVILVFDFHHMIADDISVQIFLRDLLRFYQKQGDALPDLPCQYRDYAQWEQLMSENEKADSPWMPLFAKPPLKTVLPYDFYNQIDFSGRRKSFTIVISKDHKERIRSMEASPFQIYLSLFLVVLRQYTGQDDLTIGIPVSGRTDTAYENVIGPFIKTLPFRIDFSALRTFDDLLARVKEQLKFVLERQEYPLPADKISVDEGKTIYNHPLFNILFVNHEIIEDDREIRNMEVIDIDTQTSKFDVSFELLNRMDDVLFTIEYRSNMYRESTIQNMINQYTHVFHLIMNNLTVLIEDIGWSDKGRPSHNSTLFDFEF